jgi:predicted type IV restriction endonuclease
MGVEAESESGLTRAVLQLLRLRGWKWIRFNPSVVQFGNQWVTPCPAGTSDFVLLKGGKTIWCELKTAKGRQRKSQKQFMQFVESAGHCYVIVRDVAELDVILTEVERGG